MKAARNCAKAAQAIEQHIAPGYDAVKVQQYVFLHFYTDNYSNYYTITVYVQRKLISIQ
jgi:hypothetical protein